MKQKITMEEKKYGKTCPFCQKVVSYKPPIASNSVSAVAVHKVLAGHKFAQHLRDKHPEQKEAIKAALLHATGITEV